jgi:hypothetical protein
MISQGNAHIGQVEETELSEQRRMQSAGVIAQRR